MFAFEKGQLRVSPRGMPVFALHWSLVVGVVVLSGWSPSWEFVMAYALIIACHQWGHARRVRSCGLRVGQFQINAIGGRCLFEGITSARQSRFIDRGGIVAQCGLFGCALLVGVMWPPAEGVGAIALDTLTVTNGLLVILNLLPFAGTDGYQLWSMAERTVPQRAPRKHADNDIQEAGGAKVLAFPVERVTGDETGQRRQAADAITAQIYEIAQRVNRNTERARRDDSDEVR